MVVWRIICDILQRPTLWGIVSEMCLLMAPLWAAVTVGVLVGWVWKPKWAHLVSDMLDSSVLDGTPSYQTLAAEASSLLQTAKSLPFSVPRLDYLKLQFPSFSLRQPNHEISDDLSSASTFTNSENRYEEEKEWILSVGDFRELYKLVEEKDGGPAWIQMMKKSTSLMGYEAWRRDRETGPPQYRSRTVFENADPETVKDFFWDDEFRSKWDDMLVEAEILEECPMKGAFMVRWVRKFPFFCSDREYIVGRRIWELDGAYYCVTRGVTNKVARQGKPRRVDLYYSSWCIRAAEGKGSATEVILFHYEDMGIPWELAKLGVRQGMWGAVKKIEPGLRAYQTFRASAAPLSRCAHLARITTRVTKNDLDTHSAAPPELIPLKPKRTLPRVILIGGAVAVACSLDRGLLTKALILGAARKLASVGNRL